MAWLSPCASTSPERISSGTAPSPRVSRPQCYHDLLAPHTKHLKLTHHRTLCLTEDGHVRLPSPHLAFQVFPLTVFRCISQVVQWSCGPCQVLLQDFGLTPQSPRGHAHLCPLCREDANNLEGVDEGAQHLTPRGGMGVHGCNMFSNLRT